MMKTHDILTYEEYDRKMSSYEAAVKRLGPRMHTLGPSHPLRMQLKKLVMQLKTLPEDVLTGYLKRRHATMFNNDKGEAQIYN